LSRIRYWTSCTRKGKRNLLAHAVTSSDVVIEENSMLGINCTVVNSYYNEKLIVGRNSKIAAGAAVYKNVESNKFVSVQGKIMKTIDSREE